jgi:hypothetical protein
MVLETVQPTAALPLANLSLTMGCGPDRSLGTVNVHVRSPDVPIRGEERRTAPVISGVP